MEGIVISENGNSKITPGDCFVRLMIGLRSAGFQPAPQPYTGHDKRLDPHAVSGLAAIRHHISGFIYFFL
jgi:hypothetical protein